MKRNFREFICVNQIRFIQDMHYSETKQYF